MWDNWQFTRVAGHSLTPRCQVLVGKRSPRCLLIPLSLVAGDGRDEGGLTELKLISIGLRYPHCNSKLWAQSDESEDQ